MPTFDWRKSVAEADTDAWGVEQWLAVATRYEAAVNARGVNDWTAFVTRAQELAVQVQGLEWAAELRSTLDTLVEQLRTKPALRQPTVFVSHQRLDATWAEWAAWAATEAHFDYWLDVHDPKLTTANILVLPPQVKSILVAGIIEMALVNCTHIVSMQTKNAQKSLWVPYEFGRAKERRLLATNAASWFENGVTPSGNGDYLWLAFCAFTSAGLKNWLDTAGRTPPPAPNYRWPPPVPSPLPN
jgi:hypothetical protein